MRCWVWSSNQRSCCWKLWEHAPREEKGEVLSGEEVEAAERGEREERGEVSSGEEVEVCSPLHHGGLAPKRMREERSGQDGRGKQHQKRRRGRQ